jgi:Flp pilus assembly protein CpaB
VAGRVGAGGRLHKISDLTSGGRRVVLTPIEANEPVLASKITGSGQRATLSALLQDGMKAVTIRVNDVEGVAGFVLPGDRVDVVLTRQQDKNLAATDVVLQNVRVLAVDQVADERTDKPSLAKAITLEVEVTAAQKLALAATVGTLSLALRKAGEAAATSTRRITLGDLPKPRWRPTIAFRPSRSCAAAEVRIHGADRRRELPCTRIGKGKIKIGIGASLEGNWASDGGDKSRERSDREWCRSRGAAALRQEHPGGRGAGGAAGPSRPRAAAMLAIRGADLAAECDRARRRRSASFRSAAPSAPRPLWFRSARPRIVRVDAPSPTSRSAIPRSPM